MPIVGLVTSKYVPPLHPYRPTNTTCGRVVSPSVSHPLPYNSPLPRKLNLLSSPPSRGRLTIPHFIRFYTHTNSPRPTENNLVSPPQKRPVEDLEFDFFIYSRKQKRLKRIAKAAWLENENKAIHSFPLYLVFLCTLILTGRSLDNWLTCSNPWSVHTPTLSLDMHSVQIGLSSVVPACVQVHSNGKPEMSEPAYHIKVSLENQLSART